MRRVFALLCLLASPVFAQDFSGLARIDAAQSQLRDSDNGGLQVDLILSQTVPYRVFTLDAPRRAVLDFREVDWRGASRAGLLNADAATDVRFGVLRPGWSRMVVDLAGPLKLKSAGMAVDDTTGIAHLTVQMVPTSAEEFAAQSGAPVDAGWGDLSAVDATQAAPVEEDGPLVVVIDPGHGGIDPGAQRDGIKEADIVLRLGIEVADALNRSGGIRAVLTRGSDVFVPLEARTTVARMAGADLFISLHADALTRGSARGASVYTLSQDGQDGASERMAERHERGDLLAGLDLNGHDDRIATVLMDLARLETGPQGIRFADRLVTTLGEAGVSLNGRPRRSGKLAVLNAADFPSVLLEVGFLSDTQDREMLSSAQSRAPLVAGIVSAVQAWAADEAARAPLVRQ